MIKKADCPACFPLVRSHWPEKPPSCLGVVCEMTEMEGRGVEVEPVSQ